MFYKCLYLLKKLGSPFLAVIFFINFYKNARALFKPEDKKGDAKSIDWNAVASNLILDFFAAWQFTENTINSLQEIDNFIEAVKNSNKEHFTKDVTVLKAVKAKETKANKLKRKDNKTALDGAGKLSELQRRNTKLVKSKKNHLKGSKKPKLSSS